MVNYDDLIRNVRDAINGKADEYAIVFVNDVVPYELFSDDKDPRRSLIMRFIDKGGTVVWIGNIPFWYRTKQGSRVRGRGFGIRRYHSKHSKYSPYSHSQVYHLRQSLRLRIERFLGYPEDQ
ncbi:hypothetical protein [Vulcanisaeta distributa]|uniref:hypothetical protein n=1 Tax=Vulcanisaeta distributa TaxID=164451 RepID=UPI0006D0964C|nr:hypothetical protein [Vulcanisaeta distributa]